jgi:WD40 repeat protein
VSEGARVETGPYVGLRAFGDSDLDSSLFFGRERERAVLVANLLASRLTVLYGPSGVGKSSLVRAGVVHELRSEIGRDGVQGHVVVYERWAGDPRAGLVAAIEEAYGPLGPAAGPADAAAAATGSSGSPLYLVLDQFEEYFLYHDPDVLVGELSELVGRPGLYVNVLVSIRDDALARLDVLKAQVPDLFANALRLDRLDREGAHTAIVAPLEAYGEMTGKSVSIEDALVDEVLDQVAVDGPGRQIEAPYLQLVLERIWREETESGSATLRLSTLSRLGGAEAIVRDHLESALSGLGDRQLDATAAVLNQLVTPSGTKIAHRPADLAEYANLPEPELERVLGTLVDERILRRIDASGPEPERCEIFHDVLAGPIADWRASWAVERERRAARRQRRRLLQLSSAALVALAVVAGIAVFALVQRSHAKTDARRARARELAANALAELPVNGQAALSQALKAAQLNPGPQSEDVLRQTLVGSYERAIVNMGATASVTAFDRSGSRLLVASENGRIRMLDRKGDVLSDWSVKRPLVGAFYTPDGRSVVAAGGDGVTIWSTRTSNAFRKLDYSSEEVTSIGPAPAAASSPAALLVGYRSHIVIVSLPALSGMRDLTVRGKPTSLEVSPDGRLLAAIVSGASGDRAMIFDLRTGRLLHALPGRRVEAIAFSPDGRLLATGSDSRAAQLWDARTGKLLHTLPHNGRVLALSFGPDGKLLATGSADGATRVWEVKTGERRLIMVGPIGPIDSVEFSSSGRFLIAGSTDRTARVYETDNGKELAVLRGSGDAVTSVAMSPDETLAVTGSSDGTARIWDPGVSDQLVAFDRGKEAVRQVSFSPDGKRMIVVRDHGVDLLTGAGKPVSTFGSGKTTIVAASFSPDSRLAAFEFSDGSVDVPLNGGPQWTMAVIKARAVAGIAWAGNDRLLTAGRRQADLWAVPSGRHLRTLSVGDRVSAVAASNDGSRAATLSRGRVEIWDLETGKPLASLSGRASAVGFSPDGSELVTTFRDRAFLWDTATGRRLHVLAGHRGFVTHFAFSPSGDVLVTGSVDHDARVWSVADGRLVTVLRGHFSPIYGVGTNPDGSWVATAGRITVGLWPVSSGQLLYYLRGPSATLTDVAFSADGRSILAGSQDGNAYLYKCDVCGDLASLEALARERLSLAPAG